MRVSTETLYRGWVGISGWVKCERKIDRNTNCKELIGEKKKHPQYEVQKQINDAKCTKNNTKCQNKRT